MITMIGSLKGGSGKSTITFNLAIWLAHAGLAVKAVDADPQSTLTDVLDVRSEEGYEPTVEVLGVEAMSDKRSLVRGCDHVLIDVGTADMDGFNRAVKLAERILVPVPPSQADIWSTQRFLQYVDSVLGKSKKRPEMLGFINRGDTHHAIRESDEAAAALVSLGGIKYIKTRLNQRTAFRRSFSEGLAVFELDPRGKASREWNALAAMLHPEVTA